MPKGNFTWLQISLLMVLANQAEMLWDKRNAIYFERANLCILIKYNLSLHKRQIKSQKESWYGKKPISREQHRKDTISWALGQGDLCWSTSQQFSLNGHVTWPGHLTFLKPVQTNSQEQGCHYLPHSMAGHSHNTKWHEALYTRVAQGWANLYHKRIFFHKILSKYFRLADHRISDPTIRPCQHSGKGTRATCNERCGYTPTKPYGHWTLNFIEFLCVSKYVFYFFLIF